jgi:putative transposase
VSANLLDRQFAAERPNQKWIADFTYIWTGEGLRLAGLPER